MEKVYQVKRDLGLLGGPLQKHSLLKLNRLKADRAPESFVCSKCQGERDKNWKGTGWKHQRFQVELFIKAK